MNYEGISRSNYFRVTDEKKYAELFEKFDGAVRDFTKEVDGETLHGFGCEDSICYGESGDIDEFFAELQPILPDGEGVTYIHVGHEGLRYASACAAVVTNKDIRWSDVGSWIANAAKEMNVKNSAEPAY